MTTTSKLTLDIYQEITEKEPHHNHLIITDEYHRPRWKENPKPNTPPKKIDLTNKNSEAHRKLYRDLGCTLRKYWEIFYSEKNNPIAHQYKPNIIK